MRFVRWLLTSVFVASSWLVFTPMSAAEDEPIPAANPYAGDKRAIRSGRSWYRNVCANCHGGRADGQGERGTGADLRKFNKGFQKFVQIVLDGRKIEGRIQYMPGWRGVLSQKDIYEIAAYVETLAMEGANYK